MTTLPSPGDSVRIRADIGSFEMRIIMGKVDVDWGLHVTKPNVFAPFEVEESSSVYFTPRARGVVRVIFKERGTPGYHPMRGYWLPIEALEPALPACTLLVTEENP